MSERFADLSPISCSEYETIGESAFYFFNPIKNRTIRQQMELPPEEKMFRLESTNFSASCVNITMKMIKKYIR